MSTIDEVISGLTILKKYPRCFMSADHDIIYAGPADPTLVSEDDGKELYSMCWTFRKDINTWYHFV